MRPLEHLEKLKEVVPEDVWPYEISKEDSKRGDMQWRYRGYPISPQYALDIVVMVTERWLLDKDWCRGPKLMTMYSRTTGGRDIPLIKAVRVQMQNDIKQEDETGD